MTNKKRLKFISDALDSGLGMKLNRAELIREFAESMKLCGPCDKNGKLIPMVKARRGDPLLGAGRKDGRLDSTATLMRYLAWAPGDSEACLDGDFTSKQLRAIADWMDSHERPGGTPARRVRRDA